MDTSTQEIREIAFGSANYESATAMRDRILRRPLGLAFSLVDLEKEHAYRHFGLFESNTLIATVMVVPRSPGSLQVRQMAVASDRQGQGIGKRLLSAVEQQLRSEGARHLVLHARDLAIGFYERLGYIPVGAPFIEVGIPHQQMEKSLDA